MILSSLEAMPKKDIAIHFQCINISYGELVIQVKNAQLWLTTNHITSLALLADNSPEWVVIDLACQQANIVFIPVPNYFSSSQVNYLLSNAQPEMVISNQALNWGKLQNSPFADFNCYRSSFATINRDAHYPKNTTKLTFTSGSTGRPKGVCLSNKNQTIVATSLVEVIAIEKPVHLVLLPLSTLLENIAGVYAPLLAGGKIIMASEIQRGFNGCELSNPQQFLHLISSTSPQSLILVPELLVMLIAAVKQGWQVPKSLTFIAVGGSKVSADLIIAAQQLNLPVYQGYGLSECGSVVSLNNKLINEPNSVGALLPHLKADIIDNELVISGNSFLGYLNQPETWGQKSVKTGDITQLEDNLLFISGRKSNVIINSYGRNISPEWLEAELLATGQFTQAVVFGDAQPYCAALLVPVAGLINEAMSLEQITQTIDLVNQKLPLYAQVKRFLCLAEPMTYKQNLFTLNGRPKRAQIAQQFHHQLQQMFQLSLSA